MTTKSMYCVFALSGPMDLAELKKVPYKLLTLSLQLYDDSVVDTESDLTACTYCLPVKGMADRRRGQMEHKAHVMKEHVLPLNICCYCLQYAWAPLDRNIHGNGSLQCSPKVGPPESVLTEWGQGSRALHIPHEYVEHE